VAVLGNVCCGQQYSFLPMLVSLLWGKLCVKILESNVFCKFFNEKKTIIAGRESGSISISQRQASAFFMN